MKRKKLAALGLTGILALGMIGCNGNTADTNTENISNQTSESEVADTSSEETQSTSVSEEGQDASVDEEKSDSANEEKNSVRELLEEVLAGKKSFLNTDGGGAECYLNNFTYFDEIQTEQPLNLTEYAFVDIDQDGEEEAVVSLDAGYNGAFEILRCKEGVVYGYQLNFRVFGIVFNNGYFMGSSGESAWNIYRISFTKTSYADENFAGCTNGYYYLDGEDVTESEYYDFVAGLTQVQWYSFDSLDGNSEETAHTSSQDTAPIMYPSLVGWNTGTIFDYEYDYLTEQNLKYVPEDVLRIARNEIFAKHGYIFETEDLKEFFSYKDWYQGTVKASDWDDSVLNEYEKKNLELISQFEKKEEKALDITEEENSTKLTDGEFTITLPSVWNEDNYYVIKAEEESGIYYYFISKNNAKYGFGGHVFTLTKSTQEQSSDFSDNFVELGKHGDYYYYMGQSTDVQFSPESRALAKEWSQLSNTYNEIAESFVADEN